MRLPALHRSAVVSDHVDDIDWSSYADGKLRRLKRGKHYHGGTGALEQAAQDAAAAMGKAVSSRIQEMGRNGKHSYLWVQFVDHHIRLGDPCPCGGRELRRTHPSFVTCCTCGAHSLVSDKAPETGGANGGQNTDTGEDPYARYLKLPEEYLAVDRKERLEWMEDVHLYHQQSTAAVEKWYGWARLDKENRVLITARYPLVGGARVPDPHHPGWEVHRVKFLPARPFGEVVDFDAFPREPEPASADEAGHAAR